MTDKKFATEYKKHIESVALPSGYQAEILSNLRTESEAYKSRNSGSGYKAILSLAAVFVLVLGLAVFLFFMRSGTNDVNYTFRVLSATNLKSVTGAKVLFRASTGEVLKDENGKELVSYTDEEGYGEVTLPSGEDYTAEVEAEGYITLEDTAENGNYYISPVMNENTYRAVLTWGKECDLDANLSVIQGDTKGRVNCYESDISGENGVVLAALDVDNEVGDGPETLTFNENENTLYRFSVLSYSALKESKSPDFSKIEAKVTLYKGDELLGTYTCGGENSGNVWCVFELEDGKLRVCDYVYSVNAATEVE